MATYEYPDDLKMLSTDEIKHAAHQIGELVDIHTALDLTLELSMYPFKDVAISLIDRATEIYTNELEG